MTWSSERDIVQSGIWVVRWWLWIGSVFMSGGQHFNVVGCFIDLDEVGERDGEVVNDICLMVSEEVSYKGMLIVGICVKFGKEDFGHIQQCFGVDFVGLVLFVSIVKEFALHHHFAHLDANLLGDPRQVIGRSFQCHALLDPWGWLQWDNDAAR